MPEELFNILSKKSSPKTVAQQIKSSSAMDKATRDNPQLVIALSNAGTVAASENRVTDEIVKKIIDSDAELKIAAQDADFKREFSDMMKDIKDGIVIAEVPKFNFPSQTGGSGGSSSGSSAGSSPGSSAAANQPEAQPQAAPTISKTKPSSEIYNKLLAVVAEIPNAKPGMIITDEHHNTLREAVRLITALVDDAKEPEKMILTFPPYFQSSEVSQRNEKSVFDWEIAFNKAVVPEVVSTNQQIDKVQGAMLVQLPQNALLTKITIRGNRFDNKKSPTSCALFLIRMPFEVLEKVTDRSNFTLFEAIASFDVKNEKEVFTKSVKPDEKLAVVDNEKFQYVISAVWDGDNSTDRFEFYGIQIFCEK